MHFGVYSDKNSQFSTLSHTSIYILSLLEVMPDPPGVLKGALTGGRGVDNITGGGVQPPPPDNSHPGCIIGDILREFLGHNFVSGLRTLKPKMIH